MIVHPCLSEYLAHYRGQELRRETRGTGAGESRRPDFTNTALTGGDE